MSDDALPPGSQPQEPNPEEPSEEEKLALRVEELKDKTRVSHQLPEVPEWNYQRPSKGPGAKRQQGMTPDASAQRTLGVGISVAYLMAGSVVCGFGLGWLIDRAAHTGTLWQTVLGLTGAVTGLIGTVLMIQRSGQKR